jgi:hypothetical protein
VNTNHGGTYTCVVSNPNGSDTTQPIVLTVIRTFAQWSAAFGIAPVPQGDDDLDGIINVSEFLHNLNPASPTLGTDRSALPQVGVDPPTGTPSYLTLTYRRNNGLSINDIAYELASVLGAAWTPRAPDAIENLAPDAATGDPRIRLKFLVGPGDVNNFVRLQLTP